MYLNNPEYVKVGDKKYKINTDFRVAIECNNIAQDDSIGNTERPLAIIYKLFGDEGLENPQDWEKLLELGIKYLSLGKDTSGVDNNTEIDMDFSEDMDYIEASFMSDYNIDLANTEMHWYKFYNLINGLSNSEMGNCCVLNRVRNLRNYDTKEIKKIEEANKQVALKKEHKKREFSDKEQKNMEEFYKSIGL